MSWPDPEAPPCCEGSFEDQRVEMEWRLRAMQRALYRDDHAAFAASLIYPVYVNTGSRCSARIASESTFLAHYDEIVTPRVRLGVLAPLMPLGFYHDAWSVAGDTVWFPAGVRGFVFNTPVWSVPLMPCWLEQHAEVPADLRPSWRRVSRCQDPQEHYAPTWVSRAEALYFDFQNRRVSASPGAGECAIDRVTISELDSRWPGSLFECMSLWSGSALTIHVDCRAVGENLPSELHFIEDKLVSLGSDNVVSTFAQ